MLLKSIKHIYCYDNCKQTNIIMNVIGGFYLTNHIYCYIKFKQTNIIMNVIGEFYSTTNYLLCCYSQLIIFIVTSNEKMRTFLIVQDVKEDYSSEYEFA